MSREDFLNQESRGGVGPHQITVTNAFWQVNPEYSEKTGSDTYFLHWEGTTNLDDRPVMGLGSFHHSWATDPDLFSTDGRMLQSQSGKKKEVGKACGRMMKAAASATAHLEGTPDDFLANASPFDASIWVGHTWEMEEVEVEFGGDIPNKREFHPVGYVGKANAAAAPQAPANAAAAPQAPQAPQAPAAPVPPNGQAPAGSDIESQVRALVQSSPDYNTFRNAALAVPGINDRPEVMIKVVDENAGYWAEKA